MINPILKKIEQEKLLDWGVILLGWKGVPEYGYIVSTEDIAEFAIHEIEKREDYISPTLIELYSVGLLSKEEATLYLEDMCEEEEINIESSFKKILLTVLEMNLKHLLKNDNYIDGLNILSNFWISWGNPKGNPHTFLKQYRYMNPDDYYSYHSKESYEKILKDNQHWLEQEKQKIFDSFD